MKKIIVIILLVACGVGVYHFGNVAIYWAWLGDFPDIDRDIAIQNYRISGLISIIFILILIALSYYLWKSRKK